MLNLHIPLPIISPDSLRASIATKSLKSFIEIFWHVVEPSTQLVWNWHLTKICEALEMVTRGEIKRLIINVPPGTGKSLIVSVFWPAWEWASEPSLRYFTASYSDKNTIRDNLRLRSIVTSDLYKKTFVNDFGKRLPKLMLTSEQWAKIRFNTTAGGWRIASSVEGMGLGEHPDRIIIDDAHKSGEILSEVSRKNVHDWFSGTMSTRIARDPAYVVPMQRLHEEDLSGYLLEQGGWKHICFPMEYEVNGKWDCSCHKVPDGLDIRTKEGELLWPELWGKKKVKRLIIDMGGELLAAGQLQQHPVPLTGGLFKRDFFKIVEPGDVPRGGRRVRGWDNAATEDGGDATAGTRMAFYRVKMTGSPDEIDVYIEDCIVVNVEDMDPIMLQTAQMDGKGCAVREEQDPGSSGKKVIAYHSRMLIGYDHAGVVISGSKITRAKPFRAHSARGRVFLVRGDWNNSWLSEVCAFPMGKHDDRVDSGSCAYNAGVLDMDFGGLLW